MLKNSKFKNTGFLYEILVRQITNDLLNENTNSSYKIIKKYFGDDSHITKELGLYKMVIEQKFDTEHRASKFLDSVIKSRKNLDDDTLKKSRYHLVKELKSNYDIDSLLKTRLHDYKLYSSIYKLFEYDEADDPVDINKSRNYVLNHLLNKNEDDSVEKEVSKYFENIDSESTQMVYELVVDKFNEKYKKLLPEQKEILKQYITNSANSDKYVSFFTNKANEFINEINTINLTDKSLKIKLSEMYNLLNENFNNIQVVKDKHLLMLMKYSELISELKK